MNHLWPEGWRCEQFQLPEGLPGGGEEGWMFKFRLETVNDKHVFVKLNKRKEENIYRTSIQVNINVI